MNLSSASVDAIPNDEPEAEIFKLKADNFYQLFDWLSLEDLVAFSQTCKLIQFYVGYCIMTKYAKSEFESTSDGIRLKDSQLQVTELSSFLRKLSFNYLENYTYNHSKHKWEAPTKIVPHMEADRFESLKEITLIDVVFTDAGLSCIKEVLRQLETVNLKNPFFLYEGKEFYENFLQFCTNLKKLSVKTWYRPSLIGATNSWLLRKYPKLEHVQLDVNYGYVYSHQQPHGPIVELQTFFEQHPNLKVLDTNVDFILENRRMFRNAKVELDILSIDGDMWKFRLLRGLLNKMHGRGIFKEFQLIDWYHSEEDLVAFNGFKGFVLYNK